jgi:hypothetical protein
MISIVLTFEGHRRGFFFCRSESWFSICEYWACVSGSYPKTRGSSPMMIEIMKLDRFQYAAADPYTLQGIVSCGRR